MNNVTIQNTKKEIIEFISSHSLVNEIVYKKYWNKTQLIEVVNKLVELNADFEELEEIFKFRYNNYLF